VEAKQLLVPRVPATKALRGWAILLQHIQFFLAVNACALCPLSRSTGTTVEHSKCGQLPCSALRCIWHALCVCLKGTSTPVRCLRDNFRIWHLNSGYANS
jgi:hypothetical protein